jgi:hypothetical protein
MRLSWVWHGMVFHMLFGSKAVIPITSDSWFNTLGWIDVILYAI